MSWRATEQCPQEQGQGAAAELLTIPLSCASKAMCGAGRAAKGVGQVQGQAEQAWRHLSGLSSHFQCVPFYALQSTSLHTSVSSLVT